MEMNNSKVTERNRLRAALISVLLIIVMLITLLAGSITDAWAYTKIGDSKTAQPEITATAGLVYCENTGKAVYSKNADKVLYPYSITKLLTAYLVLENCKLDDVVTISAEPPKREESKIHLAEGERISINELLHGMLIYSGNDAACALAEAVSGSEAEFAKLMTETAKEWGCKNTSFANASGWLDEKHFTTAEDYMIVARKAFGKKEIRDICGTVYYTIPATNKSEARDIKTRVKLLEQGYPGVLGGKTGYWEDYDCSIVLRYKQDDLSLIVILLNDTSEAREADCKTLLSYAQNAVEGYIVADTNQAVGKMWIRGGKKTHLDVYVDSAVRAYPADGKESSIKTKIVAKDGVSSPLKSGDVVGTYEVYVDGELTETRKLSVHEDNPKGFITSEVYISNVAFVCILIGLLVCVIITRVAHRTIRRRRKRRRKMMDEMMRHK